MDLDNSRNHILNPYFIIYNDYFSNDAGKTWRKDITNINNKKPRKP